MRTLTSWQIIVIVTVFMAYLLHYPCRKHLYFVKTEIDFQHYIDPKDDISSQKYTEIIVTLGYLSYVAGKLMFASIPIQALRSPLVLILITITFAPLFTFLFAVIDTRESTLRVEISMALWILIRFVTAAAWIGVVQIVPYWIPPSHHARVMAVLNLSWLLGDVIARFILSSVYHAFDENWRSVFYASGIIATIAILPTVILVRDTPVSRGLPPIEDNEYNVYHNLQQKLFEEHTVSYSDANAFSVKTTRRSFYISASQSFTTSSSKGQLQRKRRYHTIGTCVLVKPLLKEPLFYAVLILNFLYLFIFYIFIAWLEHSSDINKETESTIAVVVPLVGSISVIAAGVWLDKIKQKHWRLSIIPIFAVVTIGCLACFTFIDPRDLSLEWMIILTILFGLSLYGPYSLMAGALSVDIGGQTAAGMVSAFVSAAGFSSGVVVSTIAAHHSYKTKWFCGTCAAVGVLIVGMVLFFYNKALYYKRNRTERIPLKIVM